MNNFVSLCHTPANNRRDASANDSGVSGRIYGMMAREMSNTANRGRSLIRTTAHFRPVPASFHRMRAVP